MKKYLIQTIKIITLALVLSAGFVFATDYIFSSPATNPPLANISAPINSDGSSQIKSGGLWTGPLTVFGASAFSGNQSILGANGIGASNLYVSGKLGIGITFSNSNAPTENLEIANENSTNGQGVIKMYMKTSSLALANNSTTYNPPIKIREVCSDSVGKLVLCPIVAPTSIPPGSMTWSNYGDYSFIVPAGVGHITIKTWGGGGGGAGGSKSSNANVGYGGDFGYGGGGGVGGLYTTQTFAIPSNLGYGSVLSLHVGNGGSGGLGEAHDSNGSGGGAGGQGGTSNVKAGNTLLISSVGGSGSPANAGYDSADIGSSSAQPGATGSAGASGGTGGAGGTDQGCSQAGYPGNPGNSPGGGGGGGAGGHTCDYSGHYSGGGGGNGASGQITISWTAQ